MKLIATGAFIIAQAILIANGQMSFNWAWIFFTILGDLISS